MPFFLRKPEVVEAIQFTMLDRDRCYNFVTCTRVVAFNAKNEPIHKIQLHNPNEIAIAEYTDWVVKKEDGSFCVLTDVEMKDRYIPNLKGVS